MVLNRIKQYIDFKGITIAAFERSIGMSNASFGKSLKTGGSIGSDKLENILSIYCDINPTWLLTGRGDMLISRNANESDNFSNEAAGDLEKKCTPKCTPECTPNSDFTENSASGNDNLIGGGDNQRSPHRYPLNISTKLPYLEDTQQVFRKETGISKSIELQAIPVFELEATAGIAAIFDTAITPSNLLYIPNLPKCDGAVYVRGNSMLPILQSGDMAVFKLASSIQYVQWGDIYIVSFSIDGDDYTVVKIVQRSEMADHMKLVSYNNVDYPPLDIPIASIRQLAHVKAWVRYNA